MDYEVLQPYRMSVSRPDMVCIQITLSGEYVRSTAAKVTPVDAATTHVTNHPQSVSDTKPGQRLRGIWIACDRQYFARQFDLGGENVPKEYQPIFRSALGLPHALQMPTLASNVVAAEQIIACRLEEPLNSLYVNAKVVEIMCNVAAQIHALASQASLPHASSAERTRHAIEVAAEIYQCGLARPPTIDRLARWVGLNRNALTLGFREHFGMTPHAYCLALRMQQASLMLSNGDLTISEVARKVGYGGYASFSRAHMAYYGKPPSAWRQTH